MAGPSILHQLLGSDSATKFVRETYLRFPFESCGGAAALVEALAPDTLIPALLQQRNLDILIGREGQLKARVEELDLTQARVFLAQGQTIGVRHVQDRHPQLQQLARQFAEDLGSPADIHFYWTPAGQPGFGWHYDAEEVFVIQLRGGKTWRLRKNTVHPWPVMEALPADQHYEREVMPVRTFRLDAGSWLYIPGGYWHATDASEESVSLSIGLRAPVTGDLLPELQKILRDAIEWRQRLPCRGRSADFSREELENAYREILPRLSESLTTALASPAILEHLLALHVCPEADV